MKRLLALVALALLAIPVPAFAAEELDVVAVDESAYPQIGVEIVLPADVAQLAPTGDAFMVVEDGKLVPAAVFTPAETITEVVLVVDTSGSMRGDALEAAVDAATAFLLRLPETARVGIVTTGGSADVAAPLGDSAVAADALNGLEAAGETALFDGVVAAASLFDADPESRAVLVVLSDGADTVSAAGPDAAASAVEGLELHAVQLVTEEGDADALAALASEGASVVSTGSDGLIAAYDRIADDVVGRYRVVYISQSAGNVDLWIRVAAGGEVLVAQTGLSLPEAPLTPIRPFVDSPAPPTPTTVVPREVTAPQPEIVAAPEGLGAPWALPAGIAAVFVGLLVIVGLSLRSAPSAKEKMADLAPAVASQTRGLLSGLSKKAEAAADSVLERRDRSGLERQLDQSGLRLRSTEFVVAGAAVAVAFAALGSMLLGGVGGIGGGVLGVMTPRIALRWLVTRRRNQFSDQLEGTLQMIGGSLRAGYGLLQAIRTVAEESPSPTADEFERVVTEHRFGRPLTQSLAAMADRLEDEDLRWVVEAIDIQQEVGGDLAEVLDTVAGTIRDRNQIRRQIRALSAEGRMSAGILIALPFGIAAMIAMISPDYLSELFTTVPGRVMLVAGFVLMFFGANWIRRIVRVVF